MSGGEAGRTLRALFMSVSLGAGHDQAQQAVKQAFAERGVELLGAEHDSVEYLSTFERSFTVDLYEFELRYAPWLYRGFYWLTDQDQPWNIISRMFTWLGMGAFKDELRELRPEVVINSFWAPAAVCDTLRAQTGQRFLNCLIVTDYRAHLHWARRETDLLMVASEETRRQMLERGVRPEQVEVTGIPISPAFREVLAADRQALRAELFNEMGLRPGVPLLLLSGGGRGHYAAAADVLTELGNLGRAVQVLVPASRQGEGTETIGGATVHHLGFRRDLPRLLAASDLVVGKAGGLTVAEATALGVPLVIYAPIPGQEEHNADFLERHGAGLWARERKDVRPLVLRALDPAEHARLSAGARAVGIPDAADRVAGAILRRLGDGLGDELGDSGEPA
ncbi:MGDG synthase family glycosyltransferase [Deinococcus sp. PESE-13]